MRWWYCAVMDGCKWDLLMERRGEVISTGLFFFQIYCLLSIGFKGVWRKDVWIFKWPVLFSSRAEQREQQKYWVMNRRKAFLSICWHWVQSQCSAVRERAPWCWTGLLHHYSHHWFSRISICPALHSDKWRIACSANVVLYWFPHI